MTYVEDRDAGYGDMGFTLEDFERYIAEIRRRRKRRLPKEEGYRLFQTVAPLDAEGSYKNPACLKIRRLLPRPSFDRDSQAEIQLELFSRLAFQTPDPFGLGLSQLAHKALHRLIGISEAVFAHQILVNTLRAEPELRLGLDLGVLGTAREIFAPGRWAPGPSRAEWWANSWVKRSITSSVLTTLVPRWAAPAGNGRLHGLFTADSTALRSCFKVSTNRSSEWIPVFPSNGAKLTLPPRRPSRPSAGMNALAFVLVLFAILT
jgi:hypothetical protein